MGTIQIDGSTPKLTIGNATAEDATILFDGNAQDYHVGLDDSSDSLVIGLGSALGTTPAMTVNSSQVVTFAQNPVFPDGGVAVADLDIDGATDIGAAIVDADLFIIDDGAGGTNRKVTASRLKTYAGTTINNATANEIVTIGSTTTELDAEANLTFSGSALQCTATLTVGVDDTGHDVKFFGATASSHMLWDESADTLNLVASTLGVGTVGTKDLGVGIHVKTSDTGCAVDNGADELVLEGTGANVGLSILSDNDWGGKIIFSDPDDADVGFILYNHNNNDLDFHVNAALRMRIVSEGCIVIGANDVFTSGSLLDIRGAASSTATSISIGTNGQKGMSFQNASYSEQGSITINSGSVAFNTSSDYRLKENQTAITDGIDRVKQLKPYRFNFKADPDKTVDGFFAHEVSGIVPEAISGEKDAMIPEVLYTDKILYTADDELPEGKNIGDVKHSIGDVKEATKINPQGIDQSKLIPILVASIIELEARVKTLEG
jgi:hypothetical protein